MILRSSTRSEWLSERLGGAPFANDIMIIEAVVDGVVQGQVALDHWTPNSARLCVSANTRSVRALMSAALRYAHEGCGRQVLRTEIPSHSVKAQRLAKLYGFTETARIADGYARGDDLILLERRS